MVSTLIIVIAAVLSLFLVWEIFRSRMPEIRSLDDWDRKKHEVDLFAFRILIEPSEEKFLRESLSPTQFRLFQRARCRLALRTLELMKNNAAMLIKLGHLARVGANPTLAKEADELISRALRLLVTLLFVQAYLWLKWLFPGWMLSVPALEMPYEELLGHLSQIHQKWQWDVQRKPVPT
jgi:hypothetical protein